MLSRRVSHALLGAQLIGALTLLRSIAFDRWITVLVSVLLIVGAMAAQRGRTWGIALAFATAVWFPVAFAIGIAPAWFCLVGLLGALPFALTFRPFARFDKGATTLLTALAVTAGTSVAMVWKEIAMTVFANVPALTPTIYPHHGYALAATLAVVVAAIASRGRLQTDEGAARVRIGEERLAVRIGESESESVALSEHEHHEHEQEDDEARRPAMARRA